MKSKGKRSDAAVWQISPKRETMHGWYDTKTLQIRSITQLLQTDIGRSAEATIVTQPVWLTWGSRTWFRYRFCRGFHRSFLNVVCWKGLFIPDTWSRPIQVTHMLCLLRHVSQFSTKLRRDVQDTDFQTFIGAFIHFNFNFHLIIFICIVVYFQYFQLYQQSHWMNPKPVDASDRYRACCFLAGQWRRYIHWTYSRNDMKIDRKLALIQGSGSKVYPRIAEATVLNIRPHLRIYNSKTDICCSPYSIMQNSTVKTCVTFFINKPNTNCAE